MEQLVIALLGLLTANLRYWIHRDIGQIKAAKIKSVKKILYNILYNNWFHRKRESKYPWNYVNL
jgi:hypothetical protein